MQPHSDHTPTHAVIPPTERDPSLKEWGEFAYTSRSASIPRPPKADFETDLAASRAYAAIDGAMRARYEGVTPEGEPWLAYLLRGEISARIIHVEVGGPESPRWDKLEVRPSIEDEDRYNESYRLVCIVRKGPIHLRIKTCMETHWDDRSNRRGGAKLGTSDTAVVEEVAKLLLDQFEREFVSDILHDARKDVGLAAVDLCRVDEHFDSVAAKANELGAQRDRILASLPEKLRRRVSAMPLEEQCIAKEYPVDTQLGVLVLTPKADGLGIKVRTSKRKSSLVSIGTFETFSPEGVEVSKDGTVHRAYFKRCSTSAGAAQIRSAAIRFASENPGAFERAALAKCAKRLVDALGKVREVKAKVRKSEVYLGSKVAAMLEARETLEGMTPASKIDFPDELPVPLAEEPIRSVPVSLW